MPFVGRYINLRDSVNRRGLFEAELAATGHAGRYQRFEAVDGRTLDLGTSTLTPGEMGCFLSHYACVREAIGADQPIHIVEDDVLFGADAIPILDQLIEQLDVRWDMLFTDIVVPMHFNTLMTLVRCWRTTGVAGPPPRRPHSIQFIDLNGAPFAGSASYVISKHGAAKLAALMEAELAKGATMQVDMLFRHFVSRGELTAACTIPFLTCVDPAAVVSTTIEGRDQHQASTLALFLLRYYFFYGRSDPQLDEMVAEIDRLGRADDDIDKLWPAMRYIVSDKYVSF